jgi:hypothetical protein
MKNKRISGVLLVLAALGAAGCTRERAAPAEAARPAAAHEVPGGLGDFTLLDHEGVSHSLYRESDAKAIVIISQGNACPISQKYSGRIHELHDALEKKGVRVWLLNANPQDDRESVIQEAKDYDFGAPILLDPSQVVARELGFTRTAEAVIIEPNTWKLLYRGAIDDRLGYGVDKQQPKYNFLEIAVNDVIAGREIAQKPSAARGCLISYREFPKLTLTKDIGPILRGKCLVCHSQGGYYPPYFGSYEGLKGWSKMVRETLVTERMPPPTFDPRYGKFKNQVFLTPEEKAKLVAWIDSGMERGKGADPLAKPMKAARARRLPPKIWEVGMDKPLQIDPKGTLEYLYLQVGGPAPYDMWMTAFDTTTTNPRQLHHESIMIVSKPLSYYEEIARKRRDEHMVESNTDGDLPLWILDAMKDTYRAGDDPYFVRKGVFASGRPQPDFLPKGTAVFIPKGHYVMLEVHYIGNGRPDAEQTKIQFYGYRSQPKGIKRIQSTAVYQTNYVIPPNQKRFIVTFRPRRFNHPIDIRFLLAHMHVRGRALKMDLLAPDGKKSTLISIPNFDFSWHTGAEIIPEKPIRVPAGGKLLVTCEFDNSASNPANPDPTKEIRFGQTFDRAEMCKMNFGFTDAD